MPREVSTKKRTSKKVPATTGGENLEPKSELAARESTVNVGMHSGMTATMMESNTTADGMPLITTTTLPINQIVICKNPGCHDIATTQTFCRFHYLASWRKGKTKEAKRKGQELEVYLKELAKKFPEEFLEKLRAEIEEMAEKEAHAAEAEESNERSGFDSNDEDEDLETIIGGIRVEDY